MTRAAILWTGGKDSCLALHRVRGDGTTQVACLATFVPDDGQEFKAHPQHLIVKQAQALKLPHLFIPVSPPYREGYVEGIKSLIERMGVDTLVTGDIDFVAGFQNWILECCEGLRVKVARPLWQNSRESLMNELLARRIEARITWINHPCVPSAWIGRTLDLQLVAELKELARAFGFDICGENGNITPWSSIRRFSAGPSFDSTAACSTPGKRISSLNKPPGRFCAEASEPDTRLLTELLPVKTGPASP